jgi:predicted house-cleaning noncanonical NTP pyrophosphatase (MazG superfamily)
VAVVPVEIVNNSGQTVRMALDENSDLLAHLKKQVRTEELVSVTLVKTAPAVRKTSAAK